MSTVQYSFAHLRGLRFWRIFVVILAVVSGWAITPASDAAIIPFPLVETDNYLLIGLGSAGVNGQAVNKNNFELGANKAPVPSTSGFLSGGGSSGGPGLLGNVPNIPLVAQPVASGIFFDGNVAITHPNGVFNLQDVGLYANLGIRTRQSAANADVGTQNSFWNDPNHFPNTFTSTGFTNPGVNNNTGGFGTDVNPNQAVQATRIDKPNQAGVFGNQDFTVLLAELTAAEAAIPLLPATGTLDVSGSGGQIQAQTYVVSLLPGLNVIDIVTGGGDFKLDNSSLVIDGPPGSMAIFRVPDHANFLVSNSNVLIGNSGIAKDSVLFYSDRPDNNAHFSFNNTVLNGVSFWSLGGNGGEINVNNGQGCTQFVADKITLNDTRFGRCAFTEVPEPASLALVVLGAAFVFARRRGI